MILGGFMGKVRNEQLNRLRTLETLYAPGPLWGIVARFKNGTEKKFSAAEYRKVKLRDPDGVEVVSRRITGSLAELGEWLDMVKIMAELSQGEEELVL